MTNSPGNELSLVQAARLLRTGQRTARQLTEACLARIDNREPEVHAWVHLDADGALAAADRCDQLAKAGHWLGPLHGLAVGIKDIFDVQGMPTAFGCDAWPPANPDHDAASVARLRHAGAIVLGKTVSTAFAMGDPGPTCNPWNLAHTPGGSSSGSAAAVADRMCFAALGTQTVGSVIRPCSFNGLAGIKPGHGAIDIAGVQALAWRLDHVGAMARTLEDAALMWAVLRKDRCDALFMSPADMELPARRPGRIWRCSALFDGIASDEMMQAIETHCEKLQASGVEIVDDPLPASRDQILDMHQVILAAEAAAVHRDGFAKYGDQYPPNISGLIRQGQSITATDYLAARQYRRDAIAQVTAAMADVDAVLTPAAASAAPAGLTSTGDRRMNAPSSFLGLPTVCFPVGVNADNLPLGLQLMALPGHEDSLLSIGRFCESLVGFAASP